MSLAIKKCWERPEYRAAHIGLPNPFRGKQHTDEAKAKMSFAAKKRCQDPEYRARMSSNTKIQFQDQKQRDMASCSAKRRWQNPEWRARKIASLKSHHPSEETLTKMSISSKALWQNPDYRAKTSAALKAFQQSPEYKARVSAIHKAQWRNPEFTERMMKARKKKPNKAELRLQSILDRYYPGEWKFVGDGQVNLGGRFPDFINVNGRKDVIELFSAYWHPMFDVAQRKEHYRQYGFRVAIIWQDELEDEERLVKTLRKKLREEL